MKDEVKPSGESDLSDTESRSRLRNLRVGLEIVQNNRIVELDMRKSYLAGIVLAIGLTGCGREESSVTPDNGLTTPDLDGAMATAGSEAGRSEERSVGKEWVSKGRSRW